MKTPFETDLNTCFRLFSFKKRQCVWRSLSLVLVGSEGRRLWANNRMTLKMNGHLSRSLFVLASVSVVFVTYVNQGFYKRQTKDYFFFQQKYSFDCLEVRPCIIN